MNLHNEWSKQCPRPPNGKGEQANVRKTMEAYCLEFPTKTGKMKPLNVLRQIFISFHASLSHLQS